MTNQKIFNAEIKAFCHNPEKIRNILTKMKADFKGVDHQIDSYFDVPNGRLKLRQGNIENALIYYQRNEVKGIKSSSVELVRLSEAQVKPLFQLMQKLYTVKVVIDKKREIYFIENVKFHLDQVKELGSFVEIEAINSNNNSNVELINQCNYYCEMFGLAETDYIDQSYSDMK